MSAGQPTPPSRRRALMLVNPTKREDPRLAIGLARLRAGSIVVDDVDFEPSAMADLPQRAKDKDMIIVSGGDGTVHRAAPLLLKAGVPVGILPTGTANDLARTLHIPTDPDAAAQIIVAGKTRTIDLGEVNGEPFFNVASIGMTADLTRALSGDLKRRWGKAAYALTAARLLFTTRPFSGSIASPDGRVDVKTLQITIGNGRYYGGGSAVEESAAIDDGHLHLYSLEMRSPWLLLPLLWAFRKGTHGRHASVRTLVGDDFEIRTSRPRSVSADGEIITKTPARFRILPGSLRVFAA